MRNWLLIGAAGSVLGYAAVHFAFNARPAPEPEQARLTAPASAEPAVLSQVVDVTEVDSLLDPRPDLPSAAGLPFDEGEPLPVIRAVAPAPPAPIPPAVE